jgi:hypothetical protein
MDRYARAWREKVWSMDEDQFKEILLNTTGWSDSTLEVLSTYPKYGTMEEVRAPRIIRDAQQAAQRNNLDEMGRLLHEYSLIPDSILMKTLRPTLQKRLGYAVHIAIRHANRNMVQLLLKHGACVEPYGVISNISNDPGTYQPILQDMIDLGVTFPEIT